jgi:hypothetical protein
MTGILVLEVLWNEDMAVATSRSTSQSPARGLEALNVSRPCQYYTSYDKFMNNEEIHVKARRK